MIKPGDIVVTKYDWNSSPVYSRASDKSRLLDLLCVGVPYFVVAVVPIDPNEDSDWAHIAPKDARWILLLGHGWSLSTWYEHAGSSPHEAQPKTQA